MTKQAHTPGPWSYNGSTVSGTKGPVGYVASAANAALIAAAPALLTEACVLRCLATSPRFQNMTVADALAELARNGCGHDDGAAIAKATGGQQ